MTSAFLIDAYNNSKPLITMYSFINVYAGQLVTLLIKWNLHSTNNADQYTHLNVTCLQYTVLGLQQKSEETFLFTLRMKESTSFIQ